MEDWMIIKPDDSKELKKKLNEKELILYGMGDTGMRIAEWCQKHQIDFFMSDKNIQGKKGPLFESVKVIEPQAIVKNCPNAMIVITSMVYENEIMADLLELGVSRERIYPCHIFMPGEVTWKDIEEGSRADFELMKQRIDMVAEWGVFQGIKSIADYGCGNRFVEKMLSENILYYPIDYIDRGEGTILCDFNQDKFPEIYAEVSLCLAMLMYIVPAVELIEHICKHTEKTVVFSFVILEGFPNIAARRKSGMVQDFTAEQIVDIFNKNGFRLVDRKDDMKGNTIMALFLFERE